MKKFFSVLIVAMLIFCSAVPAFADNGGYFTPYEVTVDSQVGAVMYDQVWSQDMTASIMRPITVLIPNGTKLTVMGEREFEGEVYLFIEFSDFNAYVKSTDVTITVDSVGEEAAFDTAGERSVIVINKDGVPIRKGPSMAYEKATEKNIPYGTVVKYQKINSQYEIDAQWAFIKYRGTEGWIYIYQEGVESIYDCAYILDDSDCYTGILETLTDGAFLTEYANPSSEVVAENIPAGTELSFKYFYENYDSISAYVEYNGVCGWLRTRNTSYVVATGEKGGIYVLAKEGLPLYEKPLDPSATSLATVPENTNLCVDKQYWTVESVDGKAVESRWMHVDYNGTKGWIFSDDIAEYCYMFSAYDLKINSAKGLDLYAAADTSSEKLSVVPDGEVVPCTYEMKNNSADGSVIWSFVEYDGVCGWIASKGTQTEYVPLSDNQPDAPLGAEAIEHISPENAPEIKNGVSPVIIIACIGTVAVAAAVAVIILKKKKSK